MALRRRIDSTLALALGLGLPVLVGAQNSELGRVAHRKAVPRPSDRLELEDGDWAALEGGEQGGTQIPAPGENAQDWESLIDRSARWRQEDARARPAPPAPHRTLDQIQASLDGLYQTRKRISQVRPQVTWDSGGYRPSKAHHKEYEALPDKNPERLARRLAEHIDPIDSRSRAAFGAGIIEIAEAVKAALAADGAGLQEAFSTGPYEVTELVVKSAVPNWREHDYGIVLSLTLHLRGLYKSHQGWHEPLDFPIRLSLLVAEDGLVRADCYPDWDALPYAAAGSEKPIDDHLLESSYHVGQAYGPLQLQGIEARIRDVVRKVLPLRNPAPRRRRPNPYRQEAYVPLSLKEATLRPDFDGNGRPDGTGEDQLLVFKNRVARIEAGQDRRKKEPQWDFQQYVGWEIRWGEEKILARPEGRLKFALYGDTDGDGLPDLILVEDRARKVIRHDPYDPAHSYFLRPAVYFLDGQDMARGIFVLGSVRFDFPPGSEGSEIRQARLVPRLVGEKHVDWDVRLELFDPLGRLKSRGLVFDRYPSNRKKVQDIGYQRPEFVGQAENRQKRAVRIQVHFATDKDHLDAKAEAALARAMKEVGPDRVVSARLTGHADDRESYTYNLDLGARRARAVRSWLVNRGIAPSLIRTKSRGEFDPLESNLTPEGKAVNRRVEGWLVVQPAPPRKPPWYGRVGVPLPPGTAGAHRRSRTPYGLHRHPDATPDHGSGAHAVGGRDSATHPWHDHPASKATGTQGARVTHSHGAGQRLHTESLPPARIPMGSGTYSESRFD